MSATAAAARGVTDEKELEATLSRMKLAARGPAPDLATRKERLRRLERVLLSSRDELAAAISADFGNRSRHETMLADVYVTVEAIRYLVDHLAGWMDAEQRHVGWAFLPASAEVIHQPLGVIGIISPWNYPVQLALSPLAGALAAGNRAMIKPSELVPRTSELLARMIREAFDPDVVTVVTGGPELGEAFTRLPFDHLVFTGSTRVGALVMRAAAENLTPVTLELGGKSPTLVGPEASLEVAASRIMTGKLFNAGQTCIAPDYVLLPEGRAESFVEACRGAVARMYPTLAGNRDYTSVISEGHYQRLHRHLEDARAKGARIVELNPSGETLLPAGRKLAPTLILQPTEEMTVLKEELFGPLLPVLTYRTLDEAIAYVNEHPRPLALYYFGTDRRNIRRVLSETVSGGVAINETMLHVAQDDLPFGGVGASGMGHYHAREGFEQFSKKKPIFRQAAINGTGLLRPPFGQAVETFLRFVLGK